MLTDHTNEIGLLEATLQGSSEAFEAIVAKYQSLVCAITFSATGDREQSEELAQQTFINVWRNLRQLEDLTKFRPWLCSATRNVIRNFLRSRRRSAEAQAAAAQNLVKKESDMAEPVEEAASCEQLAVLRLALERIPQDYREPLVLYYREEKLLREVAEQLGLSEEAARQRVSRARKMLREQVASMLESTLARTKPGKAFTAAVVASIAALTAEGTTAAAAGAAVSAAGAKTSTAALLSTAAGKLVAAAAVVVVGVGAVVTYKLVSKQAEQPVPPEAIVAPAESTTGGEDSTASQLAEATRADRDVSSGPVTVEEDAADSVDKDTASHMANTTSSPAGADKADGYVFKPKGVLSGLITDVNTGEPVTDARVYISVRRIYSTETDANGFYSFEKIRSDGEYHVTVFSKKYIGIREWARQSIHLEKDTQIVKHFELARGCQIELRVVDEAGHPVERARLASTWLADEKKREIGDRIERDRTNEQGYVLLGGFRPADTPYLITVTHRRDGEFVERDGMRVRQTHWDYAPAKLEVTLTDPNVIEYRPIVLQKGLEIQGYAEYLDAVPAGDLDIGAEPDWWHSWNVPESYPVDADGYFTLKYILPGNYSISAGFPPDEDGSRRARSVMETQLPAEAGELLVVTIPEKSPGSLASISGKVVFSSGAKPRYISIGAHSPNLRTGYVDLGRDRSGKLRDEFVIDRLEPGVYQLRFSGEGIEEKTVHNVRAPTEGLVVELAAKKKGKLRGKVVDKARGEPITEFKIRASGQRNWLQVSDPNGHFDFEVLGTSSRTVQVSAEGFALKISGEIQPDADERTVIELGIGAAIEGTVVDETGTPIEGATISYRYRQSREESPDSRLITASDPNGYFMIEEIPADEHWQWYVFEHPDYAKETRFIELEENLLTEAEIVLKRGGSVEGYAYDEQGRPAANTTLYFLDETQFSYWKENRGRLGTAKTDEHGYYRIDHLPEQICFAFKGDPGNTLGTSVTSIIPSSDEIRRLDFGGPGRATGRLIEDGRPLARAKVVLRGSRAPWETTFEASYVTDSNGRFTFRGVPAGKRHLYYELEDVHGDAKWMSLGIRDFQSGADTDLGDFEITPGVVTVRIETERPDEPLGSLNVALQEFQQGLHWGRRVGQLLPRREPNDPYVFDKLAPGTYQVIVSRNVHPATTTVAKQPVYPEVRRVFELAKGRRDLELNVMIPAGSASLAGKVISGDSKNPEHTLVLRSTDQTIRMSVISSSDGGYRLANLPAGDYTIGSAWTDFRTQEVSLGRGEHKSLDVHIPDPGVSRDGYLVVQVISEDGLPLTGTTVWLDRSGQAIYPHFDTDKGKSFKGQAGEYLLNAQHPGFAPVRQRVLMKARSQCNIQQLLDPVVITMNSR